MTLPTRTPKIENTAIMSRLEAMTAESAAQTSSKRKNAPKEDEDDGSGSDGDSDVVSHHWVLLFRVKSREGRASVG